MQQHHDAGECRPTDAMAGDYDQPIAAARDPTGNDRAGAAARVVRSAYACENHAPRGQPRRDGPRNGIQRRQQERACPPVVRIPHLSGLLSPVNVRVDRFVQQLLVPLLLFTLDCLL